ncbi:MAG: hypothetical protein KDC87_17020 [Planctomycetes bacterium]|nr:hypothetical protein [Planctomycetota bacterium]MCB9870383.1 hypothetical protein [Planctomycetota bacterium]MCB9889374.1 hypothetical protein [Planctomycetota bacterium]
MTKASKKATLDRGSRSGPYQFVWQGISIGFEGIGRLTGDERTDHVKSARRAIESVFKKSALRRWNDGSWKKAHAPSGEGHVHGLARLVTGELNRGVKAGVGLTFTARTEDSIVGMRLGDGRAITSMEDGDLDIKPDGTLCWWVSETEWKDEITFLIMVEGVPGEGAMATVDAGMRKWMPDGCHEMLVRLTYDCPYAPTKLTKSK